MINLTNVELAYSGKIELKMGFHLVKHHEGSIYISKIGFSFMR